MLILCVGRATSRDENSVPVPGTGSVHVLCCVRNMVSFVGGAYEQG